MEKYVLLAGCILLAIMVALSSCAASVTTTLTATTTLPGQTIVTTSPNVTTTTTATTTLPGQTIVTTLPNVTTTTTATTTALTTTTVTSPPTSTSSTYALTVTNTQKADILAHFTMGQLQALPATSGYGGTKNKAGTITTPILYTGVALTDLLNTVGGITSANSVKITASDGFTKTFTYAQITQGNLPCYDLLGNTLSFNIQPVILLAYQAAGQALDSSTGPLEVVILTTPNYVADSSNFVKMVVQIDII